MLFAGSKSRRIVVASRSRWLRKRTAKADVLGMTLGQFLGSHEYANRLRPHAGSMGNVEGASRPGVRVFQTESLCSRAADRASACGHDRQLPRHDAGRTHDPDTRLIQIVGRRGLTSGFAAILAIYGDSFGYPAQSHPAFNGTKSRTQRPRFCVAARPCGRPRIGTKYWGTERDPTPAFERTGQNVGRAGCRSF